MPEGTQSRNVLLFGVKSYWHSSRLANILRMLEPHLTEGKRIGLDVDESALKFFENLYDRPRETYVEGALEAFEPTRRGLEESGQGSPEVAREYFEGIYDRSDPEGICRRLIHDFLERRTKQILGRKAGEAPEWFSVPYRGFEFLWDVYRAARDRKAVVFALESAGTRNRRAKLDSGLRLAVRRIPRGGIKTPRGFANRLKFRRRMNLKRELDLVPRELEAAQRIARDNIGLAVVGAENIEGLRSLEIPGVRWHVANTEATKMGVKKDLARARYLERLDRAKKRRKKPFGFEKAGIKIKRPA
ncbi:MAG: hypothetical protein NT067_02910 [Candidatus Diapherotrites archaeon]|nr:hypothetical protein [Candidatus Diapherotrites archaeon]